MRKFLAAALAAVMLCLFSVVGFAVDKSDFNLLPVAEISFLSDVLPQFNRGNGNYVVPVEIPEKNQTLNYLSFWNNLHNPDSYYSFVRFYYGSLGDVPYFTVNVFPKSNYKFSTFLERHGTSSTASCLHYGFWYSTYTTNRIFSSVNFKYDAERKIFVFYSMSTHKNHMPFHASCLKSDLQAAYFLDNVLFSAIPPSYSVSTVKYQYISDITSFALVNIDDYQPPVTDHTLTVNYLYAEGVPAAAPVTQTLAAGEGYSIRSPEIAGYTPSTAVVSGTMPDDDLVIDVYYSKTFFPLTVRYQYQDGTKAAPDVVQQYPAGYLYDIPSPQITGYQPDRLTVTGTMPGNALEETVTYTIKSYTLTIDYRYEDGTQAAATHREEVPFGAQYSVPSPAIAGYTPSVEMAAGVMPGADKRITVTYRRASGGSSDAGSSGSESGGSSGGDGGASWPVGSSGVPPFSGSDPFEIGGELPSYTQDPFARPEQWPDSEYLAFSPEYLYHVGSMLRANLGTVVGIGIYVFMIVLTVYVAFHVIDIFQ